MHTRDTRLKSSKASHAVCVLLLCCACVDAYAQAPGGGAAVPVGYTEVMEQEIARSVQLPGYVESPTTSRVASEIEGLVMELMVREGDTVKQGQPMAKLRTTPLELRRRSARAQLQEAEARLKLAQRNLERSKELFNAKTVSQQQFDESVYEAAAWESRIESLKADIASVEFDISRSTLRAPFEGVVVARRTEVGEWADAGQDMFELMSLSDLEVHVDVPERYFTQLRERSPATVTFDSIPGKSVDASVRAIIPRADPQARTFPVKLRLNGDHGNIGTGMLARVNLPLGGTAKGVLVPKDAVTGDGQSRTVFVIGPDGTVAPVTVSTGAGAGAWIEVTGELHKGQKVITRGNERLQPGQKVNPEFVSYPPP